MSLLQIAYLILSTYIQSCTSATLDKTIQPSGEIWLEQSGLDLEPTWNHSYNTIQLGQVMSIEFDFKFYGRSNDANGASGRAGYTENFFRIGHNAKGGESACNGEKSSYPAMFLAKISKGNILDIRVSSGTGTSCTASNYLTDYDGELNTNISHHIKISLNNTQVVVEITGGGKSDYYKQWAREPTPEDYLGNAVDAWFLSNSFYDDIPYNRGWGSFNNIIIKSNNDTFAPTAAPTTNPIKQPSKSPSNNPSVLPTKYPTISTTIQPSKNPSKNPTLYPTKFPTKTPFTFAPSENPTKNPTLSPTNNPTKTPTKNPTLYPTKTPFTFGPSETPTMKPTTAPITPGSPTGAPSSSTKTPTKNPTRSPTNNPTNNPTKTPSKIPSETPTKNPILLTIAPSYTSINPTKVPSTIPSKMPTKTPVTDGEIRELQSTMSILDINNGNSNLNEISLTFTDLFAICIAIAVFLVGCCMFCGVVILCKKKIKSNHAKFEQSVCEIDKHNLEIDTQTTSTQIQKNTNVELIRTDYKKGVKKFDNFNIKQNNNSQYLSDAQKEQLKVTPMGVWSSNNNNNIYLSEAQRNQSKITAKGLNGIKPDEFVVEKSQDSAFQTAGYIAAGSPSIHNNNLDEPLSPKIKETVNNNDMYGMAVENQMTIGIVEQDSSDSVHISLENDENNNNNNEDEYEYYYEDEDEFDNIETIQ